MDESTTGRVRFGYDRGMRLSTIILWLLVAGVAAGVAILLFDLATGYAVASLYAVAPSCFIFAGCCIPAAACAHVRDRGKLRPLMMSGIVAAVLAFAVWLLAMMAEADGSAAVAVTARFAAIPSVWSVMVMAIGLLSLARCTALWVRILRVGSCVAILLLGAQILAWVWLSPVVARSPGWRTEDRFHETMYRIFGVLAILSACGALVTFIAARARQLSGDETVPDEERLPFQLVCPRCGEEQVLRTAGDACARCGLRVKVTLP